MADPGRGVEIKSLFFTLTAVCKIFTARIRRMEKVKFHLFVSPHPRQRYPRLELGYPHSQDWGILPSRDGYPPPTTGVPPTRMGYPWQGLGYPRSEMGYPLIRTGVPPCPGMGYSHWLTLDLLLNTYPCQRFQCYLTRDTNSRWGVPIPCILTVIYEITENLVYSAEGGAPPWIRHRLTMILEPITM